MSRTICVNLGNGSGLTPPWSYNSTSTYAVGVRFADLLDDQGVSTGISAEWLQPFTGSNTNGSPVDAHGWPAQVWFSYLYYYADGDFIKLSGLATGTVFHLELAGRHDDNMHTTYTVTPSNYGPQYYRNSRSATAHPPSVFTGVVGEDGTIIINMTRSGTASILNGFRLILDYVDTYEWSSNHADDFTDTNGVELSVHDYNWIALNGEMLISSNSVTGNNTSAHSLYRYSGSYHHDQYAEGVVSDPSGAGTVGVAVRCAASSHTGYTAEVGGVSNQIFVSKYVDGAYTDMYSASQAISEGDVLRIEVIGNALEVSLNGTSLYSTIDYDITTGSPGVSAYDSAATSFLRSWEGGEYKITPRTEFFKTTVPWTSQPPAGTPIDRSTPLGRKVSNAFVPYKDTAVEVVTGTIGTPNQLSSGAGRYGRRVDSPNTWQGHINFPTLKIDERLLDTSTGHAMYMIYRYAENAGNETQSAMSLDGPANAYGVSLRVTLNVSTPRIGYQVRAWTSRWATLPVTFGEEAFIGVSVAPNRDLMFSKNSEIEYVSGASSDWVAPPEDITLLASTAVGEHCGLNAGFSLAIMFGEELTEAEARELGANPWQIFKPRDVWLPVPEPTYHLMPFRIPWRNQPQ